MTKKLASLLILILTFSLTLNVFAASSVSDINSLGQLVYSGMENYVSPITINYTRPSDISKTVLNNILSGAYIGDDYTAISYSDMTVKEVTDSSNLSSVDLIITPTYVDTPAQEAYINQKVPQIVSSVVLSGMTDYQKAAALHDWVVSHVKYDTTLKEISDYSALIDGKTVCRGYSMLLYKLLTNAGLNAHIVTGEVVTGFRYRHSATGHAWNMVELNGSWYFIDSTNDGLSTDSTTKFFLVSGKVLQENGFIWDQSKFPSAASNYTITATTSSTTTTSTAASTSASAILRIRLSELTFSTSPVTLLLNAVYSDRTKAHIPNSEASWTSSNTAVASVDSSGVVSFTGNAGKVTITASYNNITVKSSTYVYYELGMTRLQYSTSPQTIQLYKVYSNGVTVAIAGMTWSSSDTSIAAISSSNSLTFTGASGNTTISGTFNGQTISQKVIVGASSSSTKHRRFSPRW